MASETIFKAMGIAEDWANECADFVKTTYEAEDTLSKVMLKSMTNVRDESLGIDANSDIPLTDYERKLVLVGFLIGKHKGEQIADTFIKTIIKKLSKDD
jgi:hypothetical protein